jgi:hypothetical protein
MEKHIMFKSAKRAWDVGEQCRENDVGRLRALIILLLIVLQFCVMGRSFAQLPPAGTPSQFDIVGFLQEATISSGAGPTTGGKMKVNGHVITVPDNTIVILPANALTWQELFTQAPQGSTGTGMAVADGAKYTYEAHVIGNRVGDTYIAGLIYLSQQDLNSGAGYINFIDYAKGDIYVGGVINKNSAGIPVNTLDSANPGARLRINDPNGKFGPQSSGDQRFTLDPDNPTIRSATGFPMCLPRTDPAGTTPLPDALCPEGNRPKDVAGNFLTTIDMPDPKAIAAGQLPDPRIMAPFEVGDYVTYAGTTMSDGLGTYVSAHTVTSNVAIYTSPGTNPAYVAVEVTIIGTGGLTVLGAGEAATRTRFEGMTTDPSRNIHLYGIDFDASGKPSDRDFGTVGVDPGPPGGAQKGRWRFRPPCTATTAGVKACTPPPAGNFLPPPREVRAVIEGAWTPATLASATGGANGLMAGQYHAPILEYIFPENVPGTPPPPNNFETIPFLALGGYTSAAGTLVGQLLPWPGVQAPNSCVAPSVQVPAAAFDVASGATNVALTATAGGTGPLNYSWLQDGTAISKDLNTTFAAPTVVSPDPDKQIVFTINVTGCNNQKATATVTVTVKAQAATAAPVLNPIAPQTVASGAPVTMTATGNAPSNYLYVWTQTAGPTPQSVTKGTGPTYKFTRTAPIGQITDEVLTFTVAATSPPSTAVPAVPAVTTNTVTATVTVKPVPDNDSITSAVYRTSKSRLDLTATSSVVNAGLTLTLQPYKTVGGVIFDPTGLGSVLTNTGGGNYTMTLVGIPQPAAGTVLQVKSNIGGQSVLTALTLVRT